MANIIKETKVIDTNKRALLKYVFISDGTQNANTTLVDASNLRFALNANGYIMSSNTHPKSTYRTTIKRIYGHGKLGGSLRLQWAGDNNSEIVTLASGSADYCFENMGDGAVLSQQETANATGDILLTSVGAAAGDTYTLIIDLRKNSEDYDAGQTADPAAFNAGQWKGHGL